MPFLSPFLVGTIQHLLPGTLRMTSSTGFTAAQTNGSSDTWFADGTQTAALLSVGMVDISTQIGASYSIATIDGALERVSGMRGSLGTLSNRETIRLQSHESNGIHHRRAFAH